MPEEEEMTIDERFKYLRLMKRQYVEAGRTERGRLLDDMERMTELHRKSLIRLMSGSVKRKPRRKQRGRTYGSEVDDALRVIAESHDYICAERLQPTLVEMATHLARHGEIDLSPRLLDQLSRISISTVRRILKRLGQDEPRLPRKGPAEANRVAREIPMKRIPWNEQQPGHFEVDSVHHCGVSSAGHYVHTVQMVDVATGWTEQVATLGRSYRAMEDGFLRILARLPFPVLEIHPDNGSEFLNAHLVHFWKEKVQGVVLSRSRPFHKNDNRFVEQKNSTLVRAYLGPARFDTAQQTNAINQLYEKM
ncbi:MAG TPA: transposase [Chloroflexi bacterium]|nr:transposase [Chloroflexota bacterium]